MLAHSTTSNLNYIQHMQHHSGAWYSNTTSVLHWVKRQRCLCVASSFCSYKLTFCPITNTWKHMQVTNSRKYAVPDNVNRWSPWNITCLDLGNDYVTTKVRTNPGRNKQLLGLPWRASIHDKFAAAPNAPWPRLWVFVFCSPPAWRCLYLLTWRFQALGFGSRLV